MYSKGFTMDINKLPTDSEILEDLINTFGLLNDPLRSDATYILRDGRIMDTGYDNFDHQHATVAQYLENKYGFNDESPDGGSKFMDGIGAIRVTPWIPAFVLPRNPLTEAQENVVGEMLNEIKNYPQVFVDELMISNIRGNQQLSVPCDEIDTDEILDAIFMYYYTGRLTL